MELSEEVKNLGVAAEVTDMKDYDPDDQLADEVSHAWRDDAFVCSDPQLDHVRSRTLKQCKIYSCF